MPPLWAYRDPGAYLRMLRLAFAAAESGQRVRLRRDGPALDATELHRAFTAALHRRINLKAGLPGDGGRGRRWTTEYDVQQRRDAAAIHRHLRERLHLEWIDTPDLRRRFTHLLSLDDEMYGFPRILEARRAVLARERDHRRHRRRPSGGG